MQKIVSETLLLAELIKLVLNLSNIRLTFTFNEEVLLLLLLDRHKDHNYEVFVVHNLSNNLFVKNI